MKTITFVLAMLVAAWTHAAVLSVFVWDAPPGGDATMIETAMAAKAIHEKLGVSVSVLVDEVGRASYLINFESWEAQGKFQDSLDENEAWQAFQASLAEDPSAQLIEVFRVSMLTN